jgi:MoaA/NifB/PqqE/SkfB family radical SAM enzyme
MSLPKTICMLPWISIETSPIGTARPCCLAVNEITDDADRKYDLNETDLQTIYNSTYMQNLRQQFRNGEKPETCNRCWQEEDAGRASKRIFSKIRLKELVDKVDYENDTPDQLWFVDLKLGNICNLKCRICGSWSSSRWAQEEIDYIPELTNKKEHLAYKFLKQGAWPRKTQTFWDNLRELLPNIKYFEFTGGEPFMIQEHFDLLQYAVDQGYAKNIDIHYNTNGTQWPDAHELWKHFKRVDIAFSIDNIDKRFEYERYGAHWTEVTENIRKFHELRDQNPAKITTQVCMTVNVQNVYYLEELCNWVNTQTFNDHYFNMLHDPKHMCIDNLTVEAKQVVIEKLRSGTFTPKHRAEISRIIKFIEQGQGSSGEEFLFKMQQTDSYRKQNFYSTHPEIARAMGYQWN